MSKSQMVIQIKLLCFNLQGSTYRGARQQVTDGDSD